MFEATSLKTFFCCLVLLAHFFLSCQVA